MDRDQSGGARALADVVRQEWPHVVATLVRLTGDLDLAEDAAQDAAIEALSSWTEQLPNNPTAWIVTVARRRAVDRIRREATGRRKATLLARLNAWQGDAAIEDPYEVFDGLETMLRDDQLRLIFGCCHPALSTEAQTALTLRSVAGLTTPEIASAFLVAESTMAQRIVRAKRKIATAAIPFALPPDSELLTRLAQVRRVIYLVFNEGYVATSGDAVIRHELCDEAIRLGVLLARLIPDDAETLGLAALMLSTHARASARMDADGVPVLLEQQNRSKWDQQLVRRAHDYLETSLRLARGGPLQIQAAISQLHNDVANAGETDWPQIELLYRRLYKLTPTPVVQLNHAVALAMAQTPATGLALIDKSGLAAELGNYRYLHAARADLLARMGDTTSAIVAYDLALAIAGPAPEGELLRRKRAALIS